MANTRLSDLAAELGLNASTVSRALKGDPRIKVETRSRVLTMASAMGYRPNLAARSLAEGCTRTIWFIIPGLENAVDREPASWAGSYLLSKGYDLLLAQHHNDLAVYERILHRLSSGLADGAVVIPHPDSSGTLETEIRNAGIPLIFLDRKLASVPIPVVTTDNSGAVDAMVEQLVLGRKAEGLSISGLIDAFGLEWSNPVELARSEGLYRAGKKFGLPVLSFDDLSSVSTVTGDFMGAKWALLCTDTSRLDAQIEFSVQALALASKQNMDIGIFDGCRGPGPECGRIVTVIQDFESMAIRASEIVLSELDGGTDSTVDGDIYRTGEELRIPAKKILELRTSNAD
ncbi:hypothetical protein MASR2M78_20340 [Treponema sp.]